MLSKSQATGKGKQSEDLTNKSMNMSNMTNIEVGRGRTIISGGHRFADPVVLSIPPALEKDCFYYQAIKSVESITDATIIHKL